MDEWKNIARMNKNRSAAGVVHLDGKIYALGGHNGLSIFESVESYDTRTGGWEGKIVYIFLPFNGLKIDHGLGTSFVKS